MSGASSPGAPAGHVLVREELLYSDDSWIHVLGGEGFALSPQDAAVLSCVLRGESEIGVLCRQLANLEIGGDEREILAQLEERFTDPRSLLDLRPALYDEAPEVIVCDFSDSKTPTRSRELVRRLRRRHKTLFLGLKENVTTRAANTLWPEKFEESGPYGTWFRFAQWARSLIRFHSSAVLVLSGHIDTILFGDLVAALPTCLVLDASWPSVIPLEDLRGAEASPQDVLPELRQLFYALRFTPLHELERLNRLNSSALATLEEYAIRNADVLLYSSVDQVAELRRDGRAVGRLLPYCPPRPPALLRRQGRRTLVLVADLEAGLPPLGPFLSAMASPDCRQLYERSLVWTNQGWLELELKGTTATITSLDVAPELPDCTVGFVFPGLLRRTHCAMMAFTSQLPMQVVPSADPHPLQEQLGEVLFLHDLTPASLASTIAQLARPGSPARESVLEAQRGLARRWAPAGVVGRMVREVRARVAPGSTGSRRRKTTVTPG